MKYIVPQHHITTIFHNDRKNVYITTTIDAIDYEYYGDLVNQIKSRILIHRNDFLKINDNLIPYDPSPCRLRFFSANTDYTNMVSLAEP